MSKDLNWLGKVHIVGLLVLGLSSPLLHSLSRVGLVWLTVCINDRTLMGLKRTLMTHYSAFLCR